MRLIDADALIQNRVKVKDLHFQQDLYVIGQGDVMHAPTIDAVPVVYGRWIHKVTKSGNFQVEDVRCSKCDFQLNFYHDLTFCPNCGAKMEAGR